MNYNLELQKIRLNLDDTTQSEARINLLKQAVQIADRNNDIECGYEFRLDLILEEAGTAQCVESFSAFSWVLDAVDKNPELFDEEDFLWEYRCMALASYRSAALSQAQIEAIFEDFKKRVEKNGYSSAAYYNVKIRCQQFLGNLEEVEQSIKLRDEQEKDDMSYCKACEKDAEIEWELSRNNYEEALIKLQELINSKHQCNRAPFNTFCSVAYHLNKNKDPRAPEYFQKAYEGLQEKEKEDSSIIEAVSLMINYLIEHNPEEALTYFEKYSAWELNAEDAFKYTFSKNIFRLFSGEGEKELQLPLKHPLYTHSNQYAVKELYQYYYQEAKELAEKFDARNQNQNLTEQLKKELTYP